MKSFSLADMHCDTPFELFSRKESFWQSDLSVSAAKSNVYNNFLQVAAVWSDKRLDNDSAYFRTLEIIDYFKSDLKKGNDASFWIDNKNTRIKFILSIEDARILNGDTERLYHLYDEGIRILTPLWRGCSCIGGAYDESVGLTDFGKLVVKTSTELRIIIDISHASEQSVVDIFDISDGAVPIIASHSDSRSVFPHKRNLSDEQFIGIKRTGGVVGINLCAEHLGYDGKGASAIDRVMEHIEHYLALAGEDTVCFGCDFDGAETPLELCDITSLLSLAEKMSALNYSDHLIEKIFYLNAENFIKKNIK